MIDISKLFNCLYYKASVKQCLYQKTTNNDDPRGSLSSLLFFVFSSRLHFLNSHLVGRQADTTTTTTTPGWQTGRIETPLDTIKVAAHFQQSDVIPDDGYLSLIHI